jgi:hypothetical protein
VDKELTWHQQIRQGAKPPERTPAPWQQRALTDAPDAAVKGTGRRQAPNIKQSHPPPFALLDKEGAASMAGGEMALTARALAERQHALATTTARLPGDAAAGTPSRRQPWQQASRPLPHRGPPPSTAGSVRSVGSFRSHCTSLPRAPSQLSVRTSASATHERLEALERLFLDEREARLRLEAQLNRVEGQQGRDAQAAGSRQPTPAHRPTFY